MNRFIMTDASNCIGCRACEVACITSHNDSQLPQTPQGYAPRIRVVQVEGIYSALACMQCDDAPCVKVCPTNALSFGTDRIKSDHTKCIGCKSCILACPFGAIDIIPQSHLNDASTFAMHILKCGLCANRTDGQQACVNACPTQAIKVITKEDLATRHQTLMKQTITSEHEAKTASTQSPIHNIVSEPRRDPQKTESTIRIQSFNEIYASFDQNDVLEQGDRCTQCGDHSFCEWTCPLHNRIPHLINLAKQGRILEAVELSHQYSSLPEVCGRVCPQDRLCEGSCTLKRHQLGSVTVGNIERFITDTAFSQGWKPDLSYVNPTDKRVAIIGAGPAGIGCADILTRNGIKAVVFDRHPEIGGMLTFGIPAFKLDKNILQKRREIFSEMGIEFNLNVEVGKDIAFDTLLQDYDAVFVGVGAYEYMKANLKNEDAQGVYDALPYLIANTKNVMGLPELSEEQPYINLEGKHVVVLGGGDTAMDCLRTAIRQKAASVTCAYRRDEANMPGSKKEVQNAKEEGVQFQFNLQPSEIALKEDGTVAGIEMIRTEMGPPDASGRRRPQEIAGSEFLLKADAIIVAFGFNAHPMPWLAPHGVKLNKWGSITAPRGMNQYCQTSNPKIFAGGDVVRGADLVVTAMSDGRRAAQGIMDYLNIAPQIALAAE